jgi:hypothetical protein
VAASLTNCSLRSLPACLSQEHKEQKAIVYFLTCACVDFVAGQPSWHGLLRYASACMHPCPQGTTLPCSRGR